MKKRIIAVLIVFAVLTTGIVAYALNRDDYDSVSEENTVKDTTESKENNESSETEPATEVTEPTAEETDPTAEEDPWVTENRVIPEVIPDFVQGDMKVYSPSDALKVNPYNFTFLPTYRDIYYWAPTCLVDLVDREEYGAWRREVVIPNEIENIEPQEMYTVSFIKHFHISKEDFEQACESKRLCFEDFRDRCGEDITDEAHEIYNADIIYTFDNEIINNYYRRDICEYTELAE